MKKIAMTMMIRMAMILREECEVQVLVLVVDFVTLQVFTNNNKTTLRIILYQQHQVIQRSHEQLLLELPTTVTHN